jgi:copper chaperone NosL
MTEEGVFRFLTTPSKLEGCINTEFTKEVTVMKRHIAIGFWVSSLVILSLAISTGAAFGQEDVTKHPSCSYCGMDRAKFAHSRIFIEYNDGSTFGACSIHCAAIDMAVHIDKSPKAIGVGDYGTKKLIDAEKAFWVIGGNKMGVMTKRAKWAFEKNEEAEAFVKENGGRVSNFNEAMRAAYEDMYEDTLMIRERRRMKKMQHKN